MRAQHIVGFIVRAFAVQVQIEGREQRRKAVRIFELHCSTTRQRGAKFIETRFASELRDKKTLGLLALHRCDFIADDHRSGLGVREKRSHFPDLCSRGIVYTLRTATLKVISMTPAHPPISFFPTHNKLE